MGILIHRPVRNRGPLLKFQLDLSLTELFKRITLRAAGNDETEHVPLLPQNFYLDGVNSPDLDTDAERLPICLSDISMCLN